MTKEWEWLLQIFKKAEDSRVRPSSEPSKREISTAFASTKCQRWKKITTRLYLHLSISSWNNWGVEHWTTSYWGVPGGEHEKSGNELIQNGGNGWRISAGVPSLRGNEREATVLMKFYQCLFTNSLFINSWQSDPFLNHACWRNFLNFSFLFQFNLDSRRRY